MNNEEKQIPEEELNKTAETQAETAEAGTAEEAPAAEAPAAEEAPKEEKSKKAKKEKTYTLTQSEMEKMEAMAKELEEKKEQFLRLAAEYDNYRKRTAKEKEGIYTNAKIDTVSALLPVQDNLDRAVAGLDEGDPHRQGIELIRKQFGESLAKLGVSEMDCVGKPFDPEKMNAVMHVEDENYGENTVVEEFQKGFTVGDKVLRFAMVKVAN